MLHFPLIDCILPSWFPIWGGERFTFFDPVFNVADSAICVSIFYALLFERKSLNIEFKDDEVEEKEGEEEKNNRKNDE
jgi:signal peptidase II